MNLTSAGNKTNRVYQTPICKKFNIGFEGARNDNVTLLLSKTCCDHLQLKSIQGPTGDPVCIGKTRNLNQQNVE